MPQAVTIIACYLALGALFALYRHFVEGEDDKLVLVLVGLVWPVVAVSMLAWLISLVIHLVFERLYPPRGR